MMFRRLHPLLTAVLAAAMVWAQAQTVVPAAGTTASSAGVDDAVVRCEAQPSAQARETCRASLTKKAPAKATMTQRPH